MTSFNWAEREKCGGIELRCPTDAQPNRCHGKYRCEATLKVELSDCKVHIPPSSEMSKTQVMCPTHNHYRLRCSCSPRRAEEKREKHSVPETGKQSAAVICHHPLANLANPTSGRCRERGNGCRSFLSPDQACSGVSILNSSSIGHQV